MVKHQPADALRAEYVAEMVQRVFERFSKKCMPRVIAFTPPSPGQTRCLRRAARGVLNYDGATAVARGYIEYPAGKRTKIWKNRCRKNPTATTSSRCWRPAPGNAYRRGGEIVLAGEGLKFAQKMLDEPPNKNRRRLIRIQKDESTIGDVQLPKPRLRSSP